jgi:hypothetical protein
MNPFDFVKASSGGDSLMPIVVFVIWIVISFFSNAQKKKKKPEQKQQKQKMPEAPGPAPSTGTMVQNEEKRTPLFDVVRHEFEVVLSKQQTKEKTVPQQTEDSRFSLETHEVEEQSYEMPAPIALKSGPPKLSLQQPSAVLFNAYDLAIPMSDADGIAASAITDVFSKEQQEKRAAQLSIAREEVRRGIVWSEILAAPIALRDKF